MLKEQQKIFNLSFFVTDFFVLIGSFYLAVIVRFDLRLDFGFGNYSPSYNAEAYTLLAILFSLFQVITFFMTGAYDLERNRNFFTSAGSVFKGLLLNSFFLLTVVFFIRLTSYSRLTVVYFFLISLVAVSTSHVLIRIAVHRILASRYNPVRLVIVGATATGRRFFKALQQGMNVEYTVVGFLDDESPPPYDSLDDGEVLTAVASEPAVRVLGNIAMLGELIERKGIQLVVFALDISEKQKLLEIKRACDPFGTEMKLLIDFPEFLPYQFKIDNFSGIPVITVQDVPLTRLTNRVIKKLFDVFFSLAVLILLMPFLLLTAIAVKLSSPGPVFFKQERVGINNRKFSMYKFRTMRIQDSEASDKTWTTAEDPRVTPLGRFLRRFSIDELPQFLNVLIGNMSVVGPRPERPHFVNRFRQEYSQYMKRHQFKSGVTGLAQVSGLRGDSSIEKRVRADIRYLENWSFWLDIKIVLLTVVKIWHDKHAY